jgi:hypothetical protein
MKEAFGDKSIESVQDYRKKKVEPVLLNYYSTFSTELGDQFLYEDEEDQEFFESRSNVNNFILNLSTSSSSSSAGPSMIELPYCPQTVEDALTCPDKDRWIEAITKELQVLDDRKVVETARNQHGSGMKTKMCFRVNYDNNFNVKYKARLVVCGYSQRKHIDYEDTYSPTASVMSTLLLLQVAAERGWFIIGFDIKGAFLLADNDFDNYAYLPSALAGEGRRRVKVLKAWYGEKQAPLLFFNHFRKKMETIGYHSCSDSPCLFKKFSDNGGEEVVLNLHVDDGLVAAVSLEIIEEFKKAIKSVFDEITFMDPVNLYTGIGIKYDQANRIVSLNQTVYIQNELSYREDTDERKLCNKNVTDTPMFNTSMNLRLEPPNDRNESLLEYTGKLRYVVDRTRPGCLNAVGEVSVGGSSSPSDLHIKTVNKIINYLQATAEMELKLGGPDPDSELFGICDAAHRTEGNSKPRYGGSLFKGWHSGAVFSFSQQGAIPSRSSMHAEINGLDKLIEYGLLALSIIRYMGYKDRGPFKIYMDSRSGIELCENLKVSAKTSSINMRVNYIRDLINRRVIMLIFVPGAINTADILTKSLPAESFKIHERTLQYGFDGVTLEQRSNEYRTKIQSKKEQIHILTSTDHIDEIIMRIKNSL